MMLSPLSGGESYFRNLTVIVREIHKQRKARR